MCDDVSRNAALASSTLLALISFSSFLMDVRDAERWLMLWLRRLTFWRARFLACGEFATIQFQINGFRRSAVGKWLSDPRRKRNRGIPGREQRDYNARPVVA